MKARKAIHLVALRGAMNAQLEPETEEEPRASQEEEEEIEGAMKEDEKKEDSKAAEEIEEAMKEDKKKKEEEEVNNYIGAWDRLAHAQLLATNVHPRC